MLAHDHSPDYTILYYCPDVASLLYSNRGNRCFNIVRPLALEFGLLCMVRQPTHVIWVARHKVTRPQTILKFRPPSSLDYRTRHGSQSGCDGVWVRWDGWAIVASFSWVCICGRCCCCCCCWWLVGDVGGAVYVGLGWGCLVVWGSSCGCGGYLGTLLLQSNIPRSALFCATLEFGHLIFTLKWNFVRLHFSPPKCVG
jgi:hypothetical protein